jgi:hypothetical protein
MLAVELKMTLPLLTAGSDVMLADTENWMERG